MNEATRAVISELLATHDFLMKSKSHSVKATAVLMLGRIHAIRVKNSPLFQESDEAIDDACAMWASIPASMKSEPGGNRAERRGK